MQIPTDGLIESGGFLLTWFESIQVNSSNGQQLMSIVDEGASLLYQQPNGASLAKCGLTLFHKALQIVVSHQNSSDLGQFYKVTKCLIRCMYQNHLWINSQRRLLLFGVRMHL